MTLDRQTLEAVAEVKAPNDARPYIHLERLIDVSTLPIGTKLYAFPVNSGETPETDACTFKMLSNLQSGTRDVVDAEFARFLERQRNAQMGEQVEVRIVFDGPPSPESGRFVEVEDASGRSINFGEWKQSGNYWNLVFKVNRAAMKKGPT